ncbi:hypothetical protein M409DRAFT_58245 [Zasmidium cellare ATCC 36951]|uniref:SnoaL-like domain-containing protein n=1 Tax=Zasmidium cellare ATCC 36951 TaxID=1080233 RepID=A0A6A6C641_ZASCE|nr:uncharacterized protein M409DRAFT_58245 [Zasmidium cellare ATCC 36951]KAF2162485.1 hypothetical protein M409DRAFT_58245 [Zasmidium cellare ATCC 36951]
MHQNSNGLAATLPVLAPGPTDLDQRYTHKWDAIITNYLIHSTCEHAEAISSRDFDLNSARWTTLDSNFKFDSWLAGTLALTGSHEWMAMLKKTAEMNPDYHIQILDISVSLALDRRHAEVFMNVRTDGLPSGVVRQKVTVLKWKLVGERWFCVERKSFMGVEA